MARRPSPLDVAAAPIPVPTQVQPQPVSEQPATYRSARSGGSQRAASRVGKRSVMYWLDPDAFRSLQLLAVDEDRTIQSLMEEAYDLLMRHHGRARATRTEHS